MYMMQLIKHHQQVFNILDTIEVSQTKATTRQLSNNASVPCITTYCSVYFRQRNIQCTTHQRSTVHTSISCLFSQH